MLSLFQDYPERLGLWKEIAAQNYCMIFWRCLSATPRNSPSPSYQVVVLQAIGLQRCVFLLIPTIPMSLLFVDCISPHSFKAIF